MDGYRVKLLFNNGETKIADLSQSLNGAVFDSLKDIEFFKRFSIRFNTIEWENGADFAPEYLYEIGGTALNMEQVGKRRLRCQDLYGRPIRTIA